MERKERLQQQLAAEYQPDAAMDALLARGREWVNTQVEPMKRMELGRYQAKKEAFEQQQREERAAEARAAAAQQAAMRQSK